jgi:hypothetical protein
MIFGAASSSQYRVILAEASFKRLLSGYISRRLTYDNYKAAQKPDLDFQKFLHETWRLGYDIQINCGSLND